MRPIRQLREYAGAALSGLGLDSREMSDYAAAMADPAAAKPETLLAIASRANVRQQEYAVRFGAAVAGVAIGTLVMHMGLGLTWGSAIGGSWGLPAMFVIGVAMSSRIRRRAALQLTRTDDVRAVAPLALLVDAPYPWFRRSVRDALVRLLPGVTDENAQLLGPEQQACLHRALPGADARLVLAILGAFERVGGGTVLPNVERLAVESGSEDVREAAKRCLPAIRERAERERLALSLVRPAGDPDREAALLRPSVGGATAPETAVRAARAPSDEARWEGEVAPPQPLSAQNGQPQS